MFDGITEKNLSRKKIGSEGVREIADALRKNNTLTTLNLSFNKIGSDGAQLIAAALEINCTLTTLNLTHNQIWWSEGGAKAIAAALRSNVALTTLKLSENRLGSNGLIAIAAALKDNDTLTTLSLRKIDLRNDGLEALIDAVKTNFSITAINISDNNKYTSSRNREALDAALAGQKEKITVYQRSRIKLLNTKIGVEDMKKIATAISTNETFTTGNDIINNITITTIVLVRNNIDVDGLKILATALLMNKSVTTLDLSQNEINYDGALALADMLMRNQSLKKIKMIKNNIGDDGAKEIATALAMNKSVVMLDLRLNGIDINGAAAMADVFLTNKTLTDFKFDGNEGADEFASIFAIRCDPRMWAISYEQLLEVRDLAKDLFGEEFSSMTMRDVSKVIMIPLCQRQKRSYALSKNQHGLKTEVFVSHSWDQPFGEFVECIIEAYNNTLRKPNVWICAFALLQGTFGEIKAQLGTGDTALHQSPFVRALKGAASYLVVRNRKTDLCDRIWCICEFIYAKRFGLIPRKTIVTGPDTFADRRTSCVNAQSFDPNDKEKIIKVLMEQSSVKDIDAYIQEFRAFGTFGTSGKIEMADEQKRNYHVTEQSMGQTEEEEELQSKDTITLQLAQLAELKREIEELKRENKELKGGNKTAENTELKKEIEELKG